MTKEEFLHLRDYIHKKTGIFFTEKKMYLLESRLTNRLNELGFASYEDYYYFLKYGGDKVNIEIGNLYDVITTNETSFFRNPPQLNAFKLILQKNYMNGKTLGSPLRIWSAACSTGEEPYTLAIILMELMESTKKNIPFTIYATDISKKAIESAKKAVFGNYSVRSMDKSYINKYFFEENSFYKLKDIVKKNIRFENMNLVDADSYRKYNYMDIIFCRNVLIYFDENVKKMVIDFMYKSLKPGGFLTIGHAESLHNISKTFQPLMFPGSIAYQKDNKL